MGRRTWESFPPRFRPLRVAGTSSSRAMTPGGVTARAGRLARSGAEAR
jgi:dihydrofolate reductase